MTRSVDSQQSPLWVRSELVRIDLIHLITYSDRDAETGPTHYYFARSNVLFDFDEDGEVEFQPLLQSIGPLSASINHLPSPGDSGLLRKPLEITLSNAPYGASAARLSATLRAGNALENARIEWTQIALAERPTTVRIDLSALVGDEHTFWYRGRVRQVGPISNESIVLSCETEMPELGWARSTDATQTEPDHVGVRWPKVIGEAKKVACINHDVGFVTTLSSADDGTGTSLVLTDATGIGSSGEGTLGGSIVSWSGKSGNTLTGVVWGVGGSPASNHPAGDIFVEAITTAIFGVADTAVNAINDVYALNPYSGYVVRLGTTFTKNITDIVDGDTRATIEFTQAQLKTTLMELAASPEVTDDGVTPVAPDQLQHPLTETLVGCAAFSAADLWELPAVCDGLSGASDPYVTMEEDEYFYIRFFRPAAGFSRQYIKVELERSAVVGTATLNVYKGRIGVDTTTLLDAQTINAGKNTYTIAATEDAEWISVEVVSTTSVTAYAYEVWQLIDNAIATDHQQATNGQRSGQDPVSSGNWFDEDDGTYQALGTGSDMISCKFDAPPGSYDTMRIRYLFTATSTPLRFKAYDSPSDYDSGTTALFTDTWYLPSQQTSPSDFNFETERNDIYWGTLEAVLSRTSQYYEISRDYISYGAVPPPNIAIAGASVGYGLRLFADVDGVVVPNNASPAYKAGAAGSLIKKPCDALRWIIEETGGPESPIEYVELLNPDNDNANQTSYATPSVTPTADRTILATILNATTGSVTPNTPTLSGNGITWTQVATVLYDDDATDRARLTVFRASGSAPSAGAVTIDCGGQTQDGVAYAIVEFPNTDTTTTNGVVQSATGSGANGTELATSALSAFADTRNATVAAFSCDSLQNITPEDGYTKESETWVELADTMTLGFLAGNDTTPTATATSSARWGAIAVELSWLQPVPSYKPKIDSDTYDTCNTNLGSVEIACDLRTMGGLSWEEVVQRVAFESRVTLVPEETAAGRVWKMMTALSTYAFTAASGSISEWARGSFVEVGRALRAELATRFLFPYAPDWSRGDGEEAYTAALVANEDSNDLTVPSTANLVAAVALYGNINADPIAFRALRDAVSAKDVAGYYTHELIRGGALFAIRDVPWWEAYAVQVGDIVNATPPWESAAVKCRVIEYIKDPSTELIELRLVEVE